jgi:endonuclease/exonuclease/phosphatase family metal-dependent hydrolase
MSTFEVYPKDMKKPVKRGIWFAGVLAGLPILIVLSIIILNTVTEFSPVVKSEVKITGRGQAFDPSRRDFTFFTWNIGYAGLGREVDFFYDGGKMTRPEQQQCLAYFSGIQKVIKENNTADFMILQEVDLYSRRAWYVNEYAGLASVLAGYDHGFATNYDCRFVPLPVMDPMGRVIAGLLTFSSMHPGEAFVQYYKSDFPWPTRLVMLKRCYLLFRFRLDCGKDLVVLNLHNSAYDSTGLLRERELTVLDSVMNSEYSRGNFVVAGGDWNSNPRGFDPKTILQGDSVTTIDPPITDAFLPGWTFVYDSLNPSNRFTDMPYRKGITRTTIIDFFVVSPNVEISKIATVPMGFKYSDHEPVLMNIRLKQGSSTSPPDHIKSF